MSVEAPEIRRSKDGRPYVLNLETGKEALYTRASTFAKTLSDGAALEAWKLRMAYIGLSKSPTLLGAESREYIDQCIAEAMDLAGANERANLGTALHTLTEWLDRNESFGDFHAEPAVWDALNRYVEITKDLEPVEIEQFVVHDRFKVAGTFDRTFRLPSGRVVVGDLKTGSTLRMMEHAIQLATYANSEHYDIATGARTPLECDKEVGVIVHVPYDPTVAETRLVWVDLTQGAALCELASAVRGFRSTATRNLKVPSPMEESK